MNFSKILSIKSNPVASAMDAHQVMSWIPVHMNFFCLFFIQPRDILCGAADEVLLALKDDKMKVGILLMSCKGMYNVLRYSSRFLSDIFSWMEIVIRIKGIFIRVASSWHQLNKMGVYLLFVWARPGSLSLLRWNVYPIINSWIISCLKWFSWSVLFMHWVGDNWH